ncbi:MAG: hypothetical protein QXV17_08190 [Candidatus Micrarchaeaceae archaeon]
MKFYDKKPDVSAFDTETFKGNIKLITCTNNEDSYSLLPQNPYEVIDFLYIHAKEYNFFYNIKFDFSAIIKPFVNEENGTIIREGKNIEIGRYKLSYVQGKFFKLQLKNKKHSNPKYFFDIAQFYKIVGYSPTLENVAQLFLGEGKSDKELDIDRKAIGEVEGYFEQHKSKIIEYGLKDSKLTYKLGVLFRDSLYEFLGAYPVMLSSPASISKAYLQLHHPEQLNAYFKLLNKYKNKEKLHKIIMSCYKGGIFHLYSIGKIEAQEIDMNSCYPDAITKLYDINDAEIEEVKEYRKIDSKDYGFYKVRMKYNSKYPIPYRTKIISEQIIYPDSTVPIETYLTQIELDFLLNEGYDINVINGIIIHTKGIKPFLDYQELYNLKNEYRNREKQLFAEGKKEEALHYKILSDRIKYVLNASYGCFAESKETMTQLSNFIYASYITAYARLNIYKALKTLRENGAEPVAIMTDAIVYEGNYKWVDSDKLGEFKLAEKGTFRFYMNGIYTIDDMIKGKRGFPSLTFEMLQNAKGVELPLTREKPMGLKEGIVQHKIDDIGDFIPYTKAIQLSSIHDKYTVNDDISFETLFNSKIKVNPILIDNNNDLPQIDKDVKIDYFRDRIKKLKYYKH